MPPPRQFLIIDDTPDEALLAEILESTGHVVIARTFEEAARAAKLRWLGALISTSLPSGNTIELARQLIHDQSTECLVLLAKDEPKRAEVQGLGLALPGAIPVLTHPPTARDLSTFATCAIAKLWTSDHKLVDLVVRFSVLKDLTPREAEVIAAAMSGAKRSVLADALGVTENTLKGPIRLLLAKCSAPSVEVLINRVLRGALE
jgi:DNA-binding NarL/FixJ family response regulator